MIFFTNSFNVETRVAKGIELNVATCSMKDIFFCISTLQ